MERPKKTKSENQSPTPVVYSAQHLRAVDNGRLSLPPDWRPQGWPTEFTLLPWPLEAPKYLLVLPPERWETMRRNLSPESLSDEQGMMLQRLVYASASRRSLDSYGRLPLPEEAMKKFGLEAEALLVGMEDKFEIWPPAKLNEAISNLDPLTIKNYVAARKL
jgi:division/cell wall cluster transcriptional repressor MraZ